MDETNQKRRFLPLALSIAVTLAATAALAASENFDEVKPGEIPDGWTCGVTGKGSPIWKVEADASAPSSPNVLKQSGSGTFPWCIRQSVRIADGFVEVKFKPLAGRADQAGGVVWRFKDGDEYYIARANALENNVSLYHVEKGRRLTIKYASAPVVAQKWHTFRVEFSGKSIKVLLDGKQYIGLDEITSPAMARWGSGRKPIASPRSMISCMGTNERAKPFSV